MTVKNNNRMDMIWHDNSFVHGHIWEVTLDICQSLQGDSSKIIELMRFTEDALFVVGAYGNEIIVSSGVIECSHSGMFSTGKTIRIIVVHRKICKVGGSCKVVGGVMTPPYISCYWEFFSFSAWSAVARPSMISSMAPFITASILYRVRPIRWSVTRPWGKL